MNIIEIINSGILQRKIIKITYRDKKGNVSQRRTEPYEIKGDKYYGYCLDKKSIRSFNIGGITRAELTDVNFEPKW